MTEILKIKLCKDGKEFKVHPKTDRLEKLIKEKGKNGRLTIKLEELMDSEGSGIKQDFYPIKD